MTNSIIPTTSPYILNDQFRMDFPAFKDPEIFQNATLTMYLTTAGNLLSPYRWGDLWTLGQELWAAHFLLLDRMDEQSVERGNNTSSGPITSKTVGAVSVTYADGALEKDSGHWNTTSFGRRFIRFAKLVGAGGDQITGNSVFPGNNLFPGNWFPGSAVACSDDTEYVGPVSEG